MNSMISTLNKMNRKKMPLEIFKTGSRRFLTFDWVLIVLKYVFCLCSNTENRKYYSFFNSIILTKLQEQKDKIRSKEGYLSIS